MSIAAIAALFGAMVVISAVPGPSDFAVVARSLGAGVGQALVMVAGIVVADILFIFAAVYGLSALASQMQWLFNAITWGCALFLVWMGVTTYRANSGEESATEASPGIRNSSWSGFLAGLMITLGDPKAIVFYMALFPAFVDLETVSVTDILVIVLVTTLAVVGVKSVYALTAERAGRLFEGNGGRRRLERMAGVVLVITGLVLVYHNLTTVFQPGG